MGVFFEASNWLILTYAKSSSLLAIMTMISYFVSFLFLPKIGQFIDSVSRKLILKYIYGFSLLFLTVFLLLLYFKIINELHLSFILAGLCIFFSFIRSSDQIVRNAYVRATCTEENFDTANRSLEVVRQAITLFVGLVGFFILEYNSVLTIVNLALITFILSFILISFLNNDNVFQGTTKDKNIFFSLSLFKNHTQIKKIDVHLRTIFIISSFPFVLIMAVNLLVSAIFKSANASFQAFILSTIPYGLGAILAGFIRYKNENGFLKNFIKNMLFFIIALLMLVLNQNIFIIYIAKFVLAFSHASIRISRSTYLMQNIPNQYFGTISSYYETISIIMIAILSLMAGFLADFFNVYIALSMIFVFAIVSILWAFKLKIDLQLKQKI